MAFASSRRAVWVAAAVTLLAGTVVTSQQPAPQQPAPPAPPPSDYGPNMPGQLDTFWDWNWGELLYGSTYTTKLIVNNLCPVKRTVNFFISAPFYMGNKRADDGTIVPALQWTDSRLVLGQPQFLVPKDAKLPLSARAMLSIPKPGCIATPFGAVASSREPTVCSTEVPPSQATEFEVIITTPPPPDPKVVRAAPYPDAIFEVIEGKLVIQAKGDPPTCLQSREEYIPGGHVHLDPDAGKGGGPRCRDWWDKEEKPRGLTRDCTKEIRDLALEYLRVTLKPLIAKNPKAWAWLPTEEQILTMSIEQLIEMKVRSRVSMRPAGGRGAGR